MRFCTITYWHPSVKEEKLGFYNGQMFNEKERHSVVDEIIEKGFKVAQYKIDNKNIGILVDTTFFRQR
jgi:hypothetical protein